MDEFEVEAALIEINSLHDSFDTANPITFCLLLSMYGNKLNDEQKEFIKAEINRLKEREHAMARKWLEKMGEISRLPLAETNKEAI
jgi:hypothetical protein